MATPLDAPILGPMNMDDEIRAQNAAEAAAQPDAATTGQALDDDALDAVSGGGGFVMPWARLGSQR